jgi:transitional endoplasmic reticulum ATPase
MLRRSKIAKRIPLFDPSPSDESEYFVHANCAIYLLRVLEKFPTINREVIKMTAWVLGANIRGAFNYLMQEMSPRERSRYNEDLEDMIDDPDEIARIIIKFLRRSKKALTENFYGHMIHLLQNRVSELNYHNRSEDAKKIADLKKMFNLTEQETDFCRFQYIVSMWQEPDEYFVDHLNCNAISGRKYLSAILQLNDHDLTGVLEGTLSRIDFYEIERHFFTIKEEFLDFFRQPSSKWLTGNLYRAVSRKAIPLESHLVDAKQTNHVLNLLKAASKESVHILLYGPAGTGKTSYALGITKSLGVKAYEILREQESCYHRLLEDDKCRRRIGDHYRRGRQSA